MCVCSALISSTPDLLLSPKPQLCPDWLRNKLPPVCPVIGPFKSSTVDKALFDCTFLIIYHLVIREHDEWFRVIVQRSFFGSGGMWVHTGAGARCSAQMQPTNR